MLEVVARSYDWWQYIKTDSVGNVYFQDSYYSSSTSVHQRAARAILRRLGIPVAYTFRATVQGLQKGIDAAFDAEIAVYRSWIKDAKEKITAKGSWRKTNLQRENAIEGHLKTIAQIEAFRTRYLDKERWELEVDDRDLKLARPAYYDAIGNDDNLLRKILKRGGVSYHHRYYGARYLKLKDLLEFRKILGASQTELTAEDLLVYRQSPELLELLRAEYSDKRVQSKIAELSCNGYNTFVLDKVYTFLANRVQRRKNKKEKKTVKRTTESEKLFSKDKELTAADKFEKEIKQFTTRLAAIGGSHLKLIK
jgi:hypothetical protein